MDVELCGMQGGIHENVIDRESGKRVGNLHAIRDSRIGESPPNSESFTGYLTYRFLWQPENSPIGNYVFC